MPSVVELAFRVVFHRDVDLNAVENLNFLFKSACFINKPIIVKVSSLFKLFRSPDAFIKMQCGVCRPDCDFASLNLNIVCERDHLVSPANGQNTCGRKTFNKGLWKGWVVRLWLSTVPDSVVPFFDKVQNIHWFNQRDVKPWQNRLNELSSKFDLVSEHIRVVSMHCDNIISHIAVLHHHTNGFVIVEMLVILKKLFRRPIVNF